MRERMLAGEPDIVEDPELARDSVVVRGRPVAVVAAGAPAGVVRGL